MHPIPGLKGKLNDAEKETFSESWLSLTAREVTVATDAGMNSNDSAILMAFHVISL